MSSWNKFNYWFLAFQKIGGYLVGLCEDYALGGGFAAVDALALLGCVWVGDASYGGLGEVLDGLGGLVGAVPVGGDEASFVLEDLLKFCEGVCWCGVVLLEGAGLLVEVLLDGVEFVFDDWDDVFAGEGFFLEGVSSGDFYGLVGEVLWSDDDA